MLMDDDEPQWTLTFFARLCATFGALALAFTYYFWLALFILGGVAYQDLPNFAKNVLLISCVPGVFFVAALLLDLRRDHSKVPENWMTRIMRDLPLLSLFPHPLRWVIRM
jgi:hypothetical protein